MVGLRRIAMVLLVVLHSHTHVHPVMVRAIPNIWIVGKVVVPSILHGVVSLLRVITEPSLHVIVGLQIIHMVVIVGSEVIEVVSLIVGILHIAAVLRELLANLKIIGLPIV